MLYLLDANVLIDADRDYYPLNRVPEFWAWIVDRATKDQTKIPLEMCEEVLKGKIPKGKDDLPNWLKANRDVDAATRERRRKDSHARDGVGLRF